MLLKVKWQRIVTQNYNSLFYIYEIINNKKINNKQQITENKKIKII
jgi:hypothetical protein